jgi:hypothetical protein
MNPVSFIIYYKATHTYALNAIAGAVIPLKNATPGHIPQEAENKLHKLIARGKLYGQWKHKKRLHLHYRGFKMSA